jgi:hypothetical protein
MTLDLPILAENHPADAGHGSNLRGTAMSKRPHHQPFDAILGGQQHRHAFAALIFRNLSHHQRHDPTISTVRFIHFHLRTQ